ncbi:MAG: hypothetical protein ACREBG_07990 [Pyrinomonadaceae bacterium]
MRGLVNDCLRWLISRAVVRLGLLLAGVERVRIRTFFKSQKRLWRRYRLSAGTPVLSHGPELELLIQEAAARAGDKAQFAVTSGSTGQPKRHLYTKRRLRLLKLTYIDVFARCCRGLGLKRTSLYVFSSLSEDDSLTSMLLAEKKLPPYLSTLQAPYRVQRHSALQHLASIYGTTAVRLWLLTLANPGVLYSTNPSTISTFLDEINDDWTKGSRLIRDWCGQPETFDRIVHIIARRLESRGSAERLARIAASKTPLSLDLCAPAVAAYICWTGGYVKPFLNRLARYLPPERYQLIPMYSMSTETIETVSHFNEREVAFLPLARGVLYEFIDETAEDRPESVRSVEQLEAGKTYTMVVSNRYGLRRYQTGDVFLCRGVIAGLPDLSFIRRRGLAYSFTGEKLTAEHVSAVFQRLCEEIPSLESDAFLTCVPSQPSADSIPHYKVLLVGAVREDEFSLRELARRCDQLLGEMNCEYKGKRESGRLGQVRFVHLSPGEFVDRIGSARQSNSWEAQFKFLPLYRHLWELTVVR